jgi:transcriptional regulator with XRE-family HTH domain
MSLRGAQVRMARAALRMSVRDLAKLAEVSPTTVTRVEADQPSNATTLRALERALELAGIEFIDENGGGPGVRLRKPL